MRELPMGLISYKKNQERVPISFLKGHTTKTVVWGSINILNGELFYFIENASFEIILFSMDIPEIVEPEIPHHV